MAWKKSLQPDLIFKGNLFQVTKSSQKHSKGNKLYTKDDETWGNLIGFKDKETTRICTENVNNLGASTEYNFKLINGKMASKNRNLYCVLARTWCSMAHNAEIRQTTNKVERTYHNRK